MSITEQADATPRQETLYITDAELIRRMGVPEKIAREAIRELDRQHRNNGFPQKQKLWGDRRYWPAVKAWLDQRNGLKIDAPAPVRKAS
jgi:hypothetical protein